MNKTSNLLSLKDIAKVSSFCLLFSAFSANAADIKSAASEKSLEVNVVQQNKKITGVVVDTKGEPVIGANVVVKGTTIGNITDLDGAFTIENVPDGATLQISYIGYKNQEIAVKNQTVINITLSEDSETLSEVVVVGYGSSVKKDLTTAVTSVKSKDFLQGAVNDAMQMVDGKVAGVTVSSTAAADPNSSSSIQVRGASSLKAGNTPLIVIDGMPGGDLRNISQQDIESITVLKDGSAAAIYGSRGANGVILVQTKQGKAGKVKISYDGYVEHDFVASKPDVLDAESYLANVTGAKDYGHRTDWYDELLNKKNIGHNHNISLSGGSESTIFRISANYKEKEGLDLVSDRQEYGLRASFKQTTLEGLLEVGGNVSYRIADEQFIPNDDFNTDYGSFKQAVQLNPTYSVDEVDAFKGSGGYSYNPVKNMTERDNHALQEYSMVDFNAKLNILKNLNTEVKLGRQGHNRKVEDYRKSTHRESIDGGYKGFARIQHQSWTDWTLEWLGNYAFTIDKHDFKIMAGYSYQEFNYEREKMQNRNFPTDAFLTNNIGAGDYEKVEGRLGMESEKTQEKTIAFLGRVNYNYNDLLLFTGSLRQEGNSKFGADHKWGLFPAASAAWRFSKLPVFENSPVVDDLKLRFSYGVTGRSGFDRYISLAKYTGYGQYYSDQMGWIMGYGPKNNPNYDLGWEKQISYNLGIDYTLFDSRLSGSLDLFIRDGKDVIGDYNVPLPPYLHESIIANVGTTSSKGFEFQVNWDAVKTQDFSYSTNVNLSYTDSELKSFSNEKYQLGFLEPTDGFPSPGNPGKAQRLQDGTPIGAFYGFRYAGVDDAGNILIYKDGNKGGETKLGADGNENDKAYLDGTGVPKWEMSWGNTFVYKEFDLSLFFRGRFGYKVMNQYEMYYGLSVIAGDNKLNSAYDENAHIKGPKVICDYFLQNGNYLRLDNITVGWTPKLKTKWISNLRVYGSLKNVFTLTAYTGVDPTTVNTTGLWPGIGGMDVYPTARNFSFGVQISY